MRRKSPALILAGILLCACAPSGPVRYPAARWIRDRDRAPIAMPAVDMKKIATGAAETEGYDQLQGVLTASGAVGAGIAAVASGGKQEALGVNNFDEAADSTWFTNRLGRRRRPVRDLLGERRDALPGRPAPPFQVLAISRQSEVPRALVRDSAGHVTLLGFEAPGLGGVSLGAQMISSMLLYAAGYNTPVNRIVETDPRSLTPAKGAKIRDRYGDPREMTAEDLALFLERISPRGGGRLRAIATEFPSGEYAGPFSYSGRRGRDRNDRIPHQHRRELRGFRIFCALLDITMPTSSGTADVFVHTELGKGYLKHYLFDFSSAFGGSGRWEALPDPSESGRPDYGRAVAEAFTLGLRAEEDDDGAGGGFGFLNADNFNPSAWRPEVSNEAFVRMTGRDAFWAARIIMRLSDSDIDYLVAASGIRDRRIARHVARSLRKRRDLIGEYGFSAVNPLDDFSVSGEGGAVRISFKDPAVEHGMAAAEGTEYRVSLLSRMGRAILAPHLEFRNTRVTLAPEATSGMHPGQSYRLRLETRREGQVWWSPPVDLIVTREEGGVKLLGIQRRYDRR